MFGFDVYASVLVWPITVSFWQLANAASRDNDAQNSITTLASSAAFDVTHTRITQVHLQVILV